ncbi:MAG TPA: 8-amino-7-oxononanoate synthase [Candidatus Binatia bacterium]|nr:8-amino-7-oxononanoate synthase [Candidatus Binatia bacterium]
MSDAFTEATEALKRRGLYRWLRRVDGDQGPEIVLDGRRALNFSSNNYLGLATHPVLKKAAQDAIERYGCGSGASRLISGNMALYDELEAKIAKLKSAEAALVLNSGYQANVGIVPALAGEGDTIFSDALNHASIIDGCRLSRAQAIIYPHCDVAFLQDALEKAPRRGRKLIVTETVFSMDGDEAPLAAIVDIAEKHGAVVMIDEAHATGVFGPNGAGVAAKLGLAERIAVQMGTLGKGLGGFGAYVGCSQALREFLVNRCRSFIFATALPPPVLAAASAAVDLLYNEPQRRLALWHNIRALREGFRALGFSIGDSESQIMPLVIGAAEKCMAFSERLLENGVFVQGIRPPTVPEGTSRLRVTAMATHTHEHLHRALETFEAVKSEMRI